MTILKKVITFFKKWAIEFTVVGIAIVYLRSIPAAVQSGDTGELVSSAWGLFVPHPPGYPLYTWIQAAFLHSFDFSSVFWRASFLNVLFSLACLYVLGFLLKENKAIAVGTMLLLAFSRLFWKYSLLPDVFILNALFAALILALYIKKNLGVMNTLWIPFLFCLGLTNHLTLVFLFPIVADVIILERKKKGIYSFLAFGIVVFISLYWSLILLNPAATSSWGNITNLKDVAYHFFRMDYGTFQLVNSKESGSTIEIWKTYTTETLLSFYGLLSLSGFLYVIFRGPQVLFNRKCILVLVTILLYPIIFFSLSNMELRGFRTEVIERFFIFSHVIIVVGIGYAVMVLSRSLPQKLLFIPGLILLVCALINFINYKAENDYSKNTLIEDYAINLLRESPKSPTVLLVHSDTRFYALRYVQKVLNIRPDVKVLASKMLFFPWFTEKFVNDSGIEIDADRIIKTYEIDMERDLILPNLGRFSFLTIFDFKNVDAYHIQFFPLGRLLTKGSGADFYVGQEVPFNIRFHSRELSQSKERYSIFRDLWSDYCSYPLFLSRYHAHAGNTDIALGLLQEALKATPWCLPAAQEYCEIKKDDFCIQSTQKIHTEYYPYW